jgi:hypothetical protein
LGAINEHGLLSTDVFERFSEVLRQFRDHNYSDRYSCEDVAKHLQDAGYRNIKPSKIPYSIGGAAYEGFPFFTAEAPT